MQTRRVGFTEFKFCPGALGLNLTYHLEFLTASLAWQFQWKSGARQGLAAGIHALDSYERITTPMAFSTITTARED